MGSSGSGVTGACMEALIARVEAEEHGPAFGARVAENQRRVFQIAYGVLGNAADAEEVAQEAFLRAYQKRSEEHTSELQSRLHLVCRLLLEKKKKKRNSKENIIKEVVALE